MSISQENILIIGASGFVGKVLVSRLLNTHKNAKLFATSRDEQFTLPDVTVYHGDLSDPEFCKKILENIDTVYYLAGYKKNITYHTKYPSDFVMGNVQPLMSFIKALQTSHVTRMVYLSSTNVGLYTPGEQDGYVVGKYINELMLDACAKQSGIDIKVVRAPGVYGPGDNFDPETANFIPSMIMKISAKVSDSEKTISVWGSGKREIQFVYVDDLVANLIAAGDSTKKFFLVGSQESLTINAIVGKIMKALNTDLVIENDASKPDKSSQLFTFNNIVKPQFDLDRGLQSTIAYYTSHV